MRFCCVQDAEHTFHCISSREKSYLFATPKYGPMLVKPRDWKAIDDGGYLITKANFVRSDLTALTRNVIKSADISEVYAGTNERGHQVTSFCDLTP